MKKIFLYGALLSTVVVGCESDSNPVLTAVENEVTSLMTDQCHVVSKLIFNSPVDKAYTLDSAGTQIFFLIEGDTVDRMRSIVGGAAKQAVFKEKGGISVIMHAFFNSVKLANGDASKITSVIFSGVEKKVMIVGEMTFKKDGDEIVVPIKYTGKIPFKKRPGGHR